MFITNLNIILNFTIINYLRKLTLFVWVLYTLWFCVPLIVLLLIHCLIIVKSVLLIQTKKYLCQINCKEMLYIIWEMCCNRLEVEDLNCIPVSKTGFRNGYPPQTLYWLYIFWLWWCPPKRNSLKLYFILKVNNTRFKKFLRFSIGIVNWKNIYPEYFFFSIFIRITLSFWIHI